MRLAVVHNIIAPYRIPLFNLLAASPGVDLNVLFMAESEPNRGWETHALRSEIRFPHQVLGGFTMSKGETHIHFNPGLHRALRRLAPDVVLVSSLSLATAGAVLFRARHGTPVISWWAGTAQTEARPGVLRRSWRKCMIPSIDGFCGYSQASVAYLHHQGVPDDRLFEVGNVTFDARQYGRAVSDAAERAQRWVEFRGMAGRRILLSVGQLIRRKNHLGLIEAFRTIYERHPECALVIVGEGPLKEEIEREAATFPGGTAILVGLVQPAQMPMYYAAADIFVDVTLRDHWSQVVGEAMAAGRPCIVSTADHASELIEDGIRGLLVDPNDHAAIAGCADRLLQAPDYARDLGVQARQHIMEHDVRRSASVILAACRQVLERRERTRLRQPR